jgi:spore coat polysaccharide biosynthesis protein SpsF
LFQSKEICVTDPELNHPRIRLTVDYQEDYDLVTEVIDKLGGRANFSSYELMDLLVNRCPELANLNAIAQIRYEKHLERATPVRLKKKVD